MSDCECGWTNLMWGTTDGSQGAAAAMHDYDHEQADKGLRQRPCCSMWVPWGSDEHYDWCKPTYRERRGV